MLKVSDKQSISQLTYEPYPKNLVRGVALCKIFTERFILSAGEMRLPKSDALNSLKGQQPDTSPNVENIYCNTISKLLLSEFCRLELSLTSLSFFIKPTK